MTARILRRRRILALIAILGMFGNATWLFVLNQEEKPDFYIYDGRGGIAASSPDYAATLPEFRNGTWWRNGRRASDIRSFVKSIEYNEDSASPELIYRLPADATLGDFIASTKAAWGAGAEGAVAYIPEAYVDTPDRMVGGISVSADF